MRELVTVDRPMDGVAVLSLRGRQAQPDLAVAWRADVVDALDALVAGESERGAGSVGA